MPEAISNTSPLLYLYRGGVLAWLPQLFNETWIPKAVVLELEEDTAYYGEVFNIALSDVLERKNDLVVGRYELPAPKGETTVAVKIVDMLGEEVLVTEEV
jgi:predicted nucleic acid-binding protein